MESNEFCNLLNNESFLQEMIHRSFSEKKTQIETMAKDIHNLKLVDTSKSPNENTIYILWGDLEITDEKGSWAFGQRSVRTCYPPHYSHSLFAFPFVRNGYQGIMLPYEDALLFRKWIVKVMSSSS